MITAKTVHFSQIVEKCGKPEPYTLWLAPEKDGRFQAALQGTRVMTVHENAAGSSADFGEVGYAKGAHGELLLFGKSLKAFEGKRVVGIKYSLLKQAPGMKRKAAEEEQPSREKPITGTTHPKVVQFPTLKEVLPSKTEGPATSLTREQMRRGIRKALDALSKDRPVAAYKVLSRLV